jgi:DNA-binding NtrC family response regulator
MSTVVAFVDDLMFVSRIREAARAHAAEVKTARKVEDLLAAARTASLVLLDLDGGRLPAMDALAALRADPELAGVPVVGFLGHENAEAASRAQALGVTRVMARGAFVQKLPDLIAGKL